MRRFIPYCSSDVWSGSSPKTEQSKAQFTHQNKHEMCSFSLSKELFYSTALFVVCVGGYAFMGSLIIEEVVKDLLKKGLDNAKVLLLSGSRYVHVCDFKSKIF